MSTLISDSAIVEKIRRFVVVHLFLLVSFPLVDARLLGQLRLVVLLIITNVLPEHMSMPEQRATLGKERVA